MMHSIKKSIGKRSPIRLVWHACKAFIAAAYYGFPAKKLIVIGITGTDGKTTTVAMLAHILHSEGIAVGALSTAFFRIRDITSWNHTEKTSPSPFVIQKFLRSLVKAQCTHAVLEVSSHGLVQHRLDYTWPQYTAITNIAQEHLDYHGTMEQYCKDKGILFTMTRPNGVQVFNVSDESFAYYKNFTHTKQLHYSTNTAVPAEIKFVSISNTTKGTKSIVQFLSQELEVTLPILGIFNQYNALCALTLCHALQLDVKVCAKHLEQFKGVPARLELVDVGQPYTVIIDFTVTPQAFSATLETLQSQVRGNGRLFVLTGACGDRMREKRPTIGAICSANAHVLVVTDDEPYTEDPAQIRREILAGTKDGTASVIEIEDRTEAIEYCMKNAQPNDVILLAGLGSYPSRMFSDGLHPWNEREVAIKAIRKYHEEK